MNLIGVDFPALLFVVEEFLQRIVFHVMEQRQWAS